MLLPKRVKYRRVQRGRMTGKATRGAAWCARSQYGLVALAGMDLFHRSRLLVLP